MLRFSLRLCLHRSVNISVRFSGQGRDTDHDCCQYKYTDKCSQNHLAVEIFYPGYGRQEGKSTQAGNAEVGRDGTGFPGCINLLLIQIIGDHNTGCRCCHKGRDGINRGLAGYFIDTAHDRFKQLAQKLQKAKFRDKGNQGAGYHNGKEGVSGNA